MERKIDSKAVILKIGTFDGDGSPKDWVFDCKGKTVGIDIDFDEGSGELIVRYGGYSIKELKQIANHINLN